MGIAVRQMGIDLGQSQALPEAKSHCSSRLAHATKVVKLPSSRLTPEDRERRVSPIKGVPNTPLIQVKGSPFHTSEL